jgi:MraZ protein
LARKVSDFSFQGTTHVVIDGKGRLTIPSRHREVLSRMGVEEVTITKHESGCLLVFPRPAWLRFKEKLMALPMDADLWRSLYLGNADDVKIDGTARVLVTPELREYAELKDEVAVVGNGNVIQIWDKARRAEFEARARTEAKPASLAGLGW